MAKNKLLDLNDHLFAQLERLNDESIAPDAMELEIRKAGAISKVASQIVNNAKITLEAVKMVSDGRVRENQLPENINIKRLA